MLSALKLVNAGLWIGLAAVALGGLPFLPAAHRLVGAERMPLAAAAALAAASLVAAWVVRRGALAALGRRLRAAERLVREGFPEEADDVLEEARSLLDRAGVSGAAGRRARAEIDGLRARILRDRPRPAREREDLPRRPDRAAAAVPSPGPPRPISAAEEEGRQEPKPLARPTPPPAAPGPALASASRSAGGAADGGEAEPRFRLFAPGGEEEGEEPPPTLWRRPAARFSPLRLAAARAAAARSGARLLGRASPPLRRGLSFLLRPAAGRLLLAAAAVAGIAFGVRLGLQSLSGPPPEGPLPRAAAPAAGEALPAAVQPFTLQVAAYLKEESALRRVEELRQRGLDAYLSVAERGGKRWYQVRISHFADPQSARETGRALRDKGWIEDFYVANTAR